ncbi:MAG: hypothetical protein NTW80_12585 [Deltaproteobacteria bacterium]|nr:hypothetical protein [Deltaproteobacteria bacterium]
MGGKTTVAVVVWLIAWGVLGSKWKDQALDFGKMYKVTLVLVALGILGTFPVLFQALGH